jgi:hypothetical protein
MLGTRSRCRFFREFLGGNLTGGSGPVSDKTVSQDLAFTILLVTQGRP